jgi:ATP-dependent helicase HrpB
LLELFPDELRFSNAVSWNAEAERVDSSEQLLYRDLVLSERRATHADAQQVAALLAQEALAKGPRAFGDPAALEQLMARLAFVARTYPNSGIAPPQEEQMQALLARLCQGRRSFAELREVGLDGAVLDELKAGDRSFVHRVAPLRCSLPGGRNVRIEYPAGNQAPYIASRLQDFFGMAQAPQIADGRVTLVLHLLAPNGRPVQVTSDLAGFWQRHYPALRRELGRRYPRHAWPENPLTAAPRSKPPR